MKAKIKMLSTDFSGEFCFTHARGAFAKDGFGVITAQPLRLSGSDVFYGMHVAVTHDGGETFSSLSPCKNLGRVDIGDGYETVMCDATPMYHAPTDKLLLIGYKMTYLYDSPPPYGTKNGTVYSVFDRVSGEFSELRHLQLPSGLGDDYYFCANGCGQSVVLGDGTVLIPVYHCALETADRPRSSIKFSSSVMRCSFDGERLEFLGIGSPISCDNSRGVYEPSAVLQNGEFFVCMRNDNTGYVAKSSDGLNYGEKRELCFDDGESVGNYNTQQHWLRCGDKLCIVYTRRGAGNDHVFRHRAPLFVAEFDTDNMCVIRSSETVAVPERGARLGNFGCTNTEDGRAFVIASEWMQTTAPDCSDYRKCMEHGSDNSIFVSEILY